MRISRRDNKWANLKFDFGQGTEQGGAVASIDSNVACDSNVEKSQTNIERRNLYERNAAI